MNKPKILIVDDSKVVLSLHSYILKDAGFECVTAEGGFEALEKLELNEVGLVLTDLNMPRMDGYELVKRIRSLDRFKSTPVIMISTEQEEHDQIRGIEAGANLYIVKPAKPDELISNVRLLMGTLAK